MNNQKELLQEMLVQNMTTNSYALDKVTDENKAYKLNTETASIGFIYRHIGETMNLFGYFLGVPSNIQNTTMGQQDTGQDFEIETSKLYIDMGYKMLENLIKNSKDEDWFLTTDTPFFGTVSRMRLFSHILFHNSHHAGQISLTLSKGRAFFMTELG
ncbi:MAG: DinB family protein [Spirosomataceae bacterium]